MEWLIRLKSNNHLNGVYPVYHTMGNMLKGNACRHMHILISIVKATLPHMSKVCNHCLVLNQQTNKQGKNCTSL